MSKKGPFMVFFNYSPFFHINNLKHETYHFNFLKSLDIFLSILVQFINFSVPKVGHLLFLHLKCCDLLNFNNFELKLMNKKKIQVSGDIYEC